MAKKKLQMFEHYVGTFLGIIDKAKPKDPDEWREAVGSLISASIVASSQLDKASGAVDDDEIASYITRRAKIIPVLMYFLEDGNNNINVEDITELMTMLALNKCIQMAKTNPDKVSVLNANLTRAFISIIANIYGNVTMEMLSPGSIQERKEVAAMAMYNRLCDALNDEIQRTFPSDKEEDDYGNNDTKFSEE